MTSTAEDGFREIQLSGKQLVFVGMAGFVIAVGIFLMGVQVGRGVLAHRGVPEASEASAHETEPPPPPASVSQGSTPPVTAGVDYTYWQTRFNGLNEGADNRFNLYLMYGF